jgi:hypothetical protein
VYAVLSLTVVRMLPVAISVLGLGLDMRTTLFLGWFGPRGIASILYLLLLVQYLGSSGYEVLIAAGVQTIVLSVLLHGVTAAPLARRYGSWGSARTRASVSARSSKPQLLSRAQRCGVRTRRRAPWSGRTSGRLVAIPRCQPRSRWTISISLRLTAPPGRKTLEWHPSPPEASAHSA